MVHMTNKMQDDRRDLECVYRNESDCRTKHYEFRPSGWSGLRLLGNHTTINQIKEYGGKMGSLDQPDIIMEGICKENRKWNKRNHHWRNNDQYENKYCSTWGEKQTNIPTAGLPQNHFPPTLWSQSLKRRELKAGGTQPGSSGDMEPKAGQPIPSSFSIQSNNSKEKLNPSVWLPGALNFSAMWSPWLQPWPSHPSQ